MDDAIQTLFQQILGTAGGALAAKLFYAVLVMLAVFGVRWRKRRPSPRVVKTTVAENPSGTPGEWQNQVLRRAK